MAPRKRTIDFDRLLDRAFAKHGIDPAAPDADRQLLAALLMPGKRGRPPVHSDDDLIALATTVDVALMGHRKTVAYLDQPGVLDQIREAFPHTANAHDVEYVDKLIKRGRAAYRRRFGQSENLSRLFATRAHRQTTAGFSGIVIRRNFDP